MRVLVACEESQAVTKELRLLGHEAFSCDIEPCGGAHPEWHLQEDVVPLLNQQWDMIIAFPPCTHLAVSGARWFEQKRRDGRQQQGIDFFMEFTNAKCDKIAIENPVGIMSSVWRKPDQIIQPYEYGDKFKKTTCLWLKGLPKLKPTNIVEPNLKTYKCGKTFSVDYCGANGKQRSKTYPGIAKAIADQWGGLIVSDLLG